jgi:RNA polymerase sigma-70 factor (ECF subfamily)
MPVSDGAEHALLEQARRLDERALSQIHDRYYPEIYRYVLYRTGRTEVADDIASETFLRLLDALHTGRAPRTTLRGWLFGVASNQVADHFRKAPRESQPLDESYAAPGQPAVEAELRLQRQDVRVALRQLTREQQETLALRFGDGFSVEETADAMGKSVNAVKALQFRALEALRRVLGVGEVSHE